MKKLLAIGIILLSAGVHRISAQPAEKIITGEIEWVSRYTWRGYELGGPGLQASINAELFGNDSHALELEAWGYTDYDISTKEIDLSLSYSFLNRNAAIRLYDYWYASEAGVQYFDYENHSTPHTLELQLEYTCDLANDNSLTLMWATFIYGDDKKLTSAGNYKQAYSSYFEIKYEGIFLSPKYECEASAGFSPWKSPMSYEVEKFSWINAELKVHRTFQISDAVELTPSVALMINPVYKDVYLTLGVACSF